jgi:hypothetical protein
MTKIQSILHIYDLKRVMEDMTTTKILVYSRKVIMISESTGIIENY